MQHCGDNGGVVQFQIREDRRHFERVSKIGVTGSPLLRAMRLHGINIRSIQQRLISVRIIALDALDQLELAHHGAPVHGIYPAFAIMLCAHYCRAWDALQAPVSKKVKPGTRPGFFEFKNA